MSKSKKKVRRGLVIGCGGVLGAAWSIAALANLRQALSWDPREAEVLIGTSAGAVLVSLLGAGVGVERLVASQRNELTDCVWDHERDSGPWLPPLPGLEFTAAALATHGLRGEVSAFTALLGLLPRGRADMQPFVRLIDGLSPTGAWVRHPATWLVTVDAQTGQRVAFGAPGAPETTLQQAVCASYAIPGWCPPVRIGGRTYLDGGMASPTSADLLAGAGLDEVVILAPMASRQPDTPRSPLARIERRVRRYMTQIVDAEVDLLERAGTRVIRLDPVADDLVVIGFNLMDRRRRRQVFETALRTTARTVQAELSAQGIA